jgi:hypothetical protein
VISRFAPRQIAARRPRSTAPAIIHGAARQQRDGEHKQLNNEEKQLTYGHFFGALCLSILDRRVEYDSIPHGRT